MTSANEALADITRSHRENSMNDNDVANCTNMIANCYGLLDSVKKEEDLDIKKVMLTKLFNKIRSCAYCKSFSHLMSNRISDLMTKFTEAAVEHNKHVDHARLDEEDAKLKKSHDNFVSMMQRPTSPEYDPFSGKPPPKAGSRRRNKKSKNYKKKSRKSRKSRKTKSRRH
jgi:hypothetical protein